MIPDYLTDQSADYIKSKGKTFRDFSAEQVLAELRNRDIAIRLHGLKKGLSTFNYGGILSKVPQLGVTTRYPKINLFNVRLYKAYARKNRKFRVMMSMTVDGATVRFSHICTGNIYRHNGLIHIGNRGAL